MEVDAPGIRLDHFPVHPQGGTEIRGIRKFVTDDRISLQGPFLHFGVEKADAAVKLKDVHRTRYQLQFGANDA